MEEEINLLSCPICGGKWFRYIEANITYKNRRNFTKDGKKHYHNRGIHQNKLKCMHCRSLIIERMRDKCPSCDFNKNFKTQIIVIKKGKKIGS